MRKDNGRSEDADQTLRGEGVFTPQALSAMSKALEATTKILGIEGDEARRRAVARFIIRLARKDDSLDAVELRDEAVAALGGIAYLAVLPVPKASNPTPKRQLTPLKGGSAAFRALRGAAEAGRSVDRHPAAPPGPAGDSVQPGEGITTQVLSAFPALSRLPP
jgi:hypothetical protein